MADIAALWPATAHAKLFERDVEDPVRVGRVPLAHASVSGDLSLVVGGLKDGVYWCVVDGGPPVAVLARSGRIARVTEDRRSGVRPTGDGEVIGDDGELVEALDDDAPVVGGVAADTLAVGDPKSQEAPLSTPDRDIVTGPRTSANTRVKAKGERPGKSLTEKVKDAAKGR